MDTWSLYYKYTYTMDLIEVNLPDNSFCKPQINENYSHSHPSFLDKLIPFPIILIGHWKAFKVDLKGFMLGKMTFHWCHKSCSYACLFKSNSHSSQRSWKTTHHSLRKKTKQHEEKLYIQLKELEENDGRGALIELKPQCSCH